MDLEILQARHGRKVVQVEIHNNWTTKKFLEANAENIPQISMHNWLK